MKITHREIVYGEGYTFYISDEGIKVNTDVAGGRNCDLAMIKWDDLAYLAEHYHNAIMAGYRPGSFHDFIVEVK